MSEEGSLWDLPNLRLPFLEQVLHPDNTSSGKREREIDKKKTRWKGEGLVLIDGHDGAHTRLELPRGHVFAQLLEISVEIALLELFTLAK